MKVDFSVGDGFLFLASGLGMTGNDLTTRVRLGEQIKAFSNSHHYIAAGRLRNVGAIGSLGNANLYTSEQTCVSIKSKIDLQQKERFDGQSIPELVSDGSYECRRYRTTP
jgi:hypothetical protein